jgi:hypothetical protein
MTGVFAMLGPPVEGARQLSVSKPWQWPHNDRHSTLSPPQRAQT